MDEIKQALLEKLGAVRDKISYKSTDSETLTLNSEYHDKSEGATYSLAVEVLAFKDDFQSGRVELSGFEVVNVHLFMHDGSDASFILTPWEVQRHLQEN